VASSAALLCEDGHRSFARQAWRRGSAAAVKDASDGQRGSVSADGDSDGRPASGLAFEVVAIPYGNVVGNSLCLFLKSKFIRKIAGSRR
jgi:hypothetical protein